MRPDGRWKARDRLTGALVARADVELLDLLGEVHFRMGDHRAAGAVWFATARDDPDAAVAAAAWPHRYGHDPAQLWCSVPPRVRDRPDAPVRQLHDRAVAAAEARQGTRRARPVATPPPADQNLGFLLAVLAVLCLAALVAIGFWTLLGWLPG